MNGDSIIGHLKDKIKTKEEKYDVVAITEFVKKEFIIELDNFCRENKIVFNYETELGINGFCFIDFVELLKYMKKIMKNLKSS